MERWKNFTSRTTLHGIKYAFDDGPVRLRRCDEIWMLLEFSPHFPYNWFIYIFIIFALLQLTTSLQSLQWWSHRIIWLVCIVSCVGIFVYQAMDRLVTYFQYPSNVNLKVVYTRNIEFPAVTICNYNKHRWGILRFNILTMTSNSHFHP